MGTVLRKQTTRPLPNGAELFTKSGQRFARWKAGKRTRTAKLTNGRDGSERIVTESPTWLAKFRDVLSIFGRGESYQLASTKLFNVPDDLSKVFNRDRAVAGIAKSDDRGRTVDVHALRHTFGTMLSKAGVSPRVAQAAMRHSSIDLTMNVYTDPRLLDVQGAVESLPEFSVTNEPAENRQRLGAGAENLVAPLVAPTADFSGNSQSTAVTLDAFPTDTNFGNSVGCNVMASNEKRSLLTSSSERFTSEAGGTRTRNLRIDSPAETSGKQGFFEFSCTESCNRYGGKRLRTVDFAGRNGP